MRNETIQERAKAPAIARCECKAVWTLDADGKPRSWMGELVMERHLARGHLVKTEIRG